MKTLLLALFLVATVSTWGQNTPPPDATKAPLDHSLLLQDWVDSYEEAKSGEQIFRPKGSREFPVSPFRMRYVFSKNGECQWLAMAANDGHFLKDGKWKMDGNILIIEKSGRVEYFKILELTKDLLRLQPSGPPPGEDHA
jgi:hypothetical protein